MVSSGADLDKLMINGRVVMRNRRLFDIDEHEVMNRVQDSLNGIKKV